MPLDAYDLPVGAGGSIKRPRLDIKGALAATGMDRNMSVIDVPETGKKVESSSSESKSESLRDAESAAAAPKGLPAAPMPEKMRRATRLGGKFMLALEANEASNPSRAAPGAISDL